MADADSHLIPGTLQASLLKCTAHARRCGAIHVLPTTLEVIEHDGVPFQVRVRGCLSTKSPEGSNPNPFLPYDPDLFVASISPTHIALLNKFNIVEILSRCLFSARVTIHH
jgi:ATP adenylyltransferase